MRKTRRRGITQPRNIFFTNFVDAHHQLGVHVDHEPASLPQLGRPRRHRRVGQVGAGDVASPLLLPQAKEHEILCGVGPAMSDERSKFLSARKSLI